MSSSDHPTIGGSSQPLLHQKGQEIQEFGTVTQVPLGLSHDARLYACTPASGSTGYSRTPGSSTRSTRSTTG